MADRRTLLGEASPQELAALFGRVDALGAVVARPGGHRVPVGGRFGGMHAVTAPSDLDGLARLLGDRSIIIASILELTLAQFQLVQLALFHGGTLSREQVLAEVGEEMVDELDADADAVAQLFLGHRCASWLTLFPGISDVVEIEGATLEEGLAEINSDVIGAVLRNLGHRKPPTRKAERIELLIHHLRDPEALRTTIAELSDDARAVLRRLVERHPQSAYSLDPAYRRRYWGGGRPAAVSPLQELEDRGLVSMGDYGDLADVWTEVVATLRGRLFEGWTRPPALDPVPLDPVAPALPAVVGTLDRLLSLWSATPAEGLAAGGIGVRAAKAAARTLGVAPTTVATLAALAIQRELLGVTTLSPATGRGRTRTTEKTGWAPTPVHTDWTQLDPALRWAHLVQAWRDARHLDESDGLPDRVVEPEPGLRLGDARDRVVDVLAELPEGTGVDVHALARHLALRHPFDVDADQVAGLVAVLRLLGMVPEHGPVGLTPIARQVLADPAGVAELIGPGERTFIVQPDHTIVAPPDLEPGLLARLDDYAVCESAAGARIYRLDDARLARAFDAGVSADTILEFLTDHSTVELPPTVERLVGDVARRHGTLKVGTATSYLVSEDPALLSRAVGIRPARLRALAPTVAVSTLPRGKLVEVLRGKGLMPVAENRDGDALQLEQRTGRALGPGNGLPPLRAAANEYERRLKRARKLARA